MHRILESVQAWIGALGPTCDRLRRQVATIEALMFACEAPPILITLVEDLYQSIDRLEDPTPFVRSAAVSAGRRLSVRPNRVRKRRVR